MIGFLVATALWLGLALAFWLGMKRAEVPMTPEEQAKARAIADVARIRARDARKRRGMAHEG